MIRLEMNRKQEAILAAMILIAALAAFVLYTGIGRAPAAAPAPEPEPAPPPLIDTINERMERHAEKTEEFLEKLEEGNYTMDNPLIILDPYGDTPLSALVLFMTDEPKQITVQVAGKTENANVSYTYGGFETIHAVPVYGLYPEMLNMVELIAEPENMLPAQTALGTLLLIETGEMPDRFPGNLILRHSDQSPGVYGIPEEPLFYFTFINMSAFDANGDYRWCYTGYRTEYPTKYAENGNMLIIIGSLEDYDAVLLEIDMLGRVLKAEPIYDEYFKLNGHGSEHVELRALLVDDLRFDFSRFDAEAEADDEAEAEAE